MKKSVFVVSLILLSFLLQTCRDDEPVNMGNVQFAVRISSLVDPGGRSLSEIPDGSVLHLSILTTNGGNSFDDIAILKFGDQYISEPIPLPIGDDYSVDGFYISSGNEILYGTPMADSPLASLVEHPLPLPFTVTEEAISTFNIEVISTKAHSPRDFGYASFGIDIVASDLFRVSVFIPGENGTLLPTGAQAYILQGEDTIYRNHLQPGANKIVFDASFDDSYTLVLIEPSYRKYTRTFVLSTLVDELNNNPLSVNLTPAITFTTGHRANPYVFRRNFSFATPDQSTYANLIIDWGDGTLEEVEVPFGGLYPREHYYPTANSYFVSIYGDLDRITQFSLNYGDGVSDISINHLPNLTSFGLSGGQTPATIDLSHNPKLAYLDVSQGTYKTLDVSNNPLLKNVSLLDNSSFEAESLNKLIHDLHQHAVANNLTIGGLNIIKAWDGSIIGPPSEAAKAELRDLRDNYSWGIAPENF